MAARKQYVVTGAVAVIPTKDGSERYMYRGAPVSEEAFTAEGIKHVLSVGLISEVEVADAADADEDETPTESWNHARIDAWAADQDPVIVFTGENPTKAQKLEQIAALAQK